MPVGLSPTIAHPASTNISPEPSLASKERFYQWALAVGRAGA